MAGHIDHVIPWRVQFSLRAGFCWPFSSPPALPLGLLGFFFSIDVFVSVTGACSFPFVLGLMAGLRCCFSHGGIISIKGLAANDGSPWILQAPNLYFSDAVVNLKYTCISKYICTLSKGNISVSVFSILFRRKTAIRRRTKRNGFKEQNHRGHGG